MKNFKKILRYLAGGLIIIGIILFAYGYIRNQNLITIIKQTIASSKAGTGFAVLFWGLLLVIIGLIVFIVSFQIGRKKKVENNQDNNSPTN